MLSQKDLDDKILDDDHDYGEDIREQIMMVRKKVKRNDKKTATNTNRMEIQNQEND